MHSDTEKTALELCRRLGIAPWGQFTPQPFECADEAAEAIEDAIAEATGVLAR